MPLLPPPQKGKSKKPGEKPSRKEETRKIPTNFAVNFFEKNYCRLGFAIAKRFVTDGCNVVVSSRNQQHVDEAVEQLQKVSQTANCQVIGTICDVLNLDDLQKLVDLTVQKFGKIDTLVVNTAGSSTLGQQIMQVSNYIFDFKATNHPKFHF